MKSPTLDSKMVQASSSPILNTNSDKLGRTSIDFFSVPKQDFAKTRLSVNMFQLKVKQPIFHNNVPHQPPKKNQFQNLSKNSGSASPTLNNFLLDISGNPETKPQNKDFLPTLERKN